MSRIIIFSDNQQSIAAWSSTLHGLHLINVTSNADNHAAADLLLVDGDKIIQDQQLLSVFKNHPIPFLILGDNWSEQQQIDALTNGASGYCNINDVDQLLNIAIDRVLKGDIWIKRHLVSKVIGTLVKMQSEPIAQETEQDDQKRQSQKLLKNLSKREFEVAEKICKGESNKVIAATLFISERTVKAHLTSIFKKLKVPDRLHLALFLKENS